MFEWYGSSIRHCSGCSQRGSGVGIWGLHLGVDDTTSACLPTKTFCWGRRFFWCYAWYCILLSIWVRKCHPRGASATFQIKLVDVWLQASQGLLSTCLQWNLLVCYTTLSRRVAYFETSPHRVDGSIPHYVAELHGPLPFTVDHTWLRVSLCLQGKLNCQKLRFAWEDCLL